MYKGSRIGNVWGIKQIIQKNTDIDNANSKLSGLVNTTYPQSIATLDTSTETLQQTKKEYEDQAVILADSKYYKQTETYKLEYLWTRLGNYAKADNVVIKIDLTNGDASGTYNLNFTVSGRYSNVIQFIYDIENDSILGFKIENFNMTGGGAADSETDSSEYSVSGNFICKEIKIDIKAIEGQTQQSTNKKTTNSTSSANPTDSTDSNSTNDEIDEQEIMEEANAVNGDTAN